MMSLGDLLKKKELIDTNKKNNKNDHEIKKTNNKNTLTYEEYSFFNDSNDVSFSDDSEYVIKKLNSLLAILEEKDFNSKHVILFEFLDAVYNWQVHIYNDNDILWCYRIVNNEEKKNKHCLIEMSNSLRKIMVVDALFSLDGRLTFLTARYHTDISNYLSDNLTNNSSLNGTVVIDVDYSLVDKISFSEVVYDLDLLESYDFFNKDNALKDRLSYNIVSSSGCSYSKKNIKNKILVK